jgi:hypothetical protein
MQLEGSCHCGAVSFSLTSAHPYPYQRCYCSICRKTQGGGGYAINLGGDADSLKVRGRKHVAIYHARLKDEGDKRAHSSTAERHFCSVCGSGLWLFSPEWPALIHPFASAIDTPAAGATGAHAFDARFQGAVGGSRGASWGSAVRRLSRRIHRRVA